MPSGKLPPEQETIRARCFRSSGAFVEFARESLEQSITQRFEAIAERFSDRIALKMGASGCTYAELNRTANRLARAIICRQAGSRDTVGLIFDHGPQAIIAILAALKAGKIYVPLDSSFPTERVTSILEDAGAKLVVTNQRDSRLASSLSRAGVQLLDLDAVETSIPEENLFPSVSADAAAYIIYTSGSTGEPKGVVQTHRNVLHQMMTYTNALMINPDDRLTQLHSHAFSASRLDIFAAILNGAALFPYSVTGRGIDGLARLLVDEELTIMHWLPSAFRHFGSILDERKRFPKIRALVLGSEPLPHQDIEIYRRHFSSDSVLVNRYGTTETGNICCCLLDQRTAVCSGTVPVGYAVEDTEVLLIDANGKEVRPNQIGEIAVKSSYLSPGYWNRPDLTSAKFQFNSAQPDERIYFTGDLGRMLPDGCLLHLGRKDFQVKIRGVRVEVGEIESALLKLAEVKDAVVQKADVAGSTDEQLVAYIVPCRSPGPSVSELRRALEQNLPTYMLPSRFVLLDALPLTFNGKIDRKALPVPDNCRPEMDTSFVAPRTPIEEKVAGMWSEVLGVAPVGVQDNFFELGGNSLLATQIISRACEAFQIDLKVGPFFEKPTVERLALVILEAQLKGDDALLAELETWSEQ
jgi:amino acid adenylation domain-containing protein